MGSLLIALASYADAKQAQGTWHIRIDDIDPPRAVPGATEAILNTLARFGLDDDQPVRYQSQHEARYTAALNALADHTYYCTCTRAALKDHPIYPGTCRQNRTPIADAALRIDTSAWPAIDFVDRFVGPQHAEPNRDFGDFIIRRRDGLWAYHFATAVDDGMEVTHVLRGQDLLTTTPQQIGLMQLLALDIPDYCHLPTLHFPDGQKLSKQHHAPAVEGNAENLQIALALLGQAPSVTLAEIVKTFDLSKIPTALKPFPRLDRDC